MLSFSRMISVIDSHTAGEPTRIVTAGWPHLPGASMAKKWEYCRQHLNPLRKMLMLEPRGHCDMFGAILTPPSRPDCQYGLLFCDSGGWLTMCGHGTIGTAVSLVQAGMVAPTGPDTVIRFDTAAGVVEAHVLTDESPAHTAWIENVASFLYAEHLPLSVPGIGDLTIDISFGGNFFCIVPAEQVGLQIEPRNGRQLTDLGLTILAHANAAYPVQHPVQTHITSMELVEFTEAGDDSRNPRNVVVFGDANFDRSPCGTGTCARMAELHAQGRLPLGQKFVHESIIGTRFEGMLVREEQVGPFTAAVPRVQGSAYITGLNTFVLDPADPLAEGFNTLSREQ